MNFVKFILLSLVVLIGFLTTVASVNNRPIIGILTQPADDELLKYGKQSFDAAYVKWIESAGARVVPVYWNSDYDSMRYLMKRINGIVFTGGEQDLNGTKFVDQARMIYRIAKEMKDLDDPFPIWGTCQGFQMLSILAAEQYILDHYDAENLSLPLKFTNEAVHSRMFGPTVKYSIVTEHGHSSMYKILEVKNYTDNLHHLGVSPAAYHKNSKLSSFFKMLSTNRDRNGKEFISSIEARNYPFYGTQFHSERPIYEWDVTEDADHSYGSVQCCQYFANFFVNECRKNNHRFTNAEEERSKLIYNWSPIYTETLGNFDEQTYFWNK